MGRYWKRALAVTTITATAAFGLTACSESTADTKSTEHTAESSAPAGSPLTAENFAERVGAAQLKAGSVHTETTMNASGTTSTLSSDSVITDDLADLQMSMTGGQMDFRIVDGMIYINLGEITGNGFVAEDLFGESASQYSAFIEQGDPQKQMETLAAAITDFAVGDETTELDGVEATEYTLTLNTKKMLESSALADLEGVDLPETVEYVMYIGPDDLPRKLVSELAGSKTESTYSKWGEKVSVEAPAEDQIVELQ